MKFRTALVLGATTLGLQFVPAAASASVVANDDPGTATTVTALPFADVVDTTAATTSDLEAAADPMDYCGGAFEHAVWYSISVAEDTFVNVDTSGSDYTAWVAQMFGPPEQPSALNCQPGGMSMQLTAGSTTLIAVYGAPATAPTSGTLSVQVTAAAPAPELSVTFAGLAPLIRQGGEPAVLLRGTFQCTTTDPNGLGWGYLLVDPLQIGAEGPSGAAHGAIELTAESCDGSVRSWQIAARLTFGTLHPGSASIEYLADLCNSSGACTSIGGSAELRLVGRAATV